MINTDDFIKRLENILDYYSISASVFADKIGVQRSALSHLLSGRNKPSLDFVMRITDNYPDVDLYWLLHGKGSFPKSEMKSENIKPTTPTLSTKENTNNYEDLFSVSQNKNQEEEIKKTDNIQQDIKREPAHIINTNSAYNQADIEQVVIFYKDGTFKQYKPGT